MRVSKHILLVIVIAQFLCTSVWFAGNAVLSDLTASLGLSSGLLARFTVMVQAGFIVGTFVFAVLAIADRFSPVKVFFFSAVAAAIFNYGLSLSGIGLTGLLTCRFITGFFLAGIYPVGMKIAADYYEVGLGKSLGFLVGALVLGTAFPHLLKTLNQNFAWQNVIYGTSILSVIGGLSMLFFVPDGPFRKQATDFKIIAFTKVFRIKEFRTAAFGYFGHMWELYAFWAFTPVILNTYQRLHADTSVDVSFYSFLIISIGSLACVLSGVFSEKVGVKRLASLSLFASAVCCLISPFVLMLGSLEIMLAFMLFWGMSVIADSPLFSSLVAKHAPAENRGAALTIVNCLGFAITIFSIQLLNSIVSTENPIYGFAILAIGPIIGLVFLVKKGVITTNKV
jgi:MFS family permease